VAVRSPVEDEHGSAIHGQGVINLGDLEVVNYGEGPPIQIAVN